jgi:hypothetical protein
MSAPARREFIPAIREGIAKSVPAQADAVDGMIDRWRDGEDPAHPLEAGVFACCDEMARRLDEHDAKSEEEDPDRCTNPDGHVWNQTAGEADEARVRGDVANDRIYCLYCGADGDA